jgi:Flp pilus assembly protein TadG
VELALLLPLLVTLLVAVVQFGLVARNALAVSHATRVAARVAVTEPNRVAIADAARSATGLPPQRVRVVVAGSLSPGGRATVTVSYVDPTDAPLIGRLVPPVTLSHRLAVFVEPGE